MGRARVAIVAMVLALTSAPSERDQARNKRKWLQTATRLVAALVTIVTIATSVLLTLTSASSDERDQARNERKRIKIKTATRAV